MSVATPLFNPTLESVQQAFDHWRASRTKRTRTPVSLQRRAVALGSSYPASHICSALKINDTALKRWADKMPSPTSLSAPYTPLVELPAEPEPVDAIDASPADNLTSSISIELGDQMQLRVHAHFTLEQILCAARQHLQGAGA